MINNNMTYHTRRRVVISLSFWAKILKPYYHLKHTRLRRAAALCGYKVTNDALPELFHLEDGTLSRDFYAIDSNLYSSGIYEELPQDLIPSSTRLAFSARTLILLFRLMVQIADEHTIDRAHIFHAYHTAIDLRFLARSDTNSLHHELLNYTDCLQLFHTYAGIITSREIAHLASRVRNLDEAADLMTLYPQVPLTLLFDLHPPLVKPFPL